MQGVATELTLDTTRLWLRCVLSRVVLVRLERPAEA